MRRGHLVHVVELTGRRLLAMEFLAVPAADAALLERAVIGNRRICLAEDDVGFVAPAKERLDLWFDIGNIQQAFGCLVAGTIVLVVAATTGTCSGQCRCRSRCALRYDG